MARSSKWSVSFKFTTKTVYTFLFCHLHATHPTHSILFDLIILITFHEQYKSCSFSLCNAKLHDLYEHKLQNVTKGTKPSARPKR